ncbi:MAG TPA: hypothetical protein VNT02_10695 [Burkholderiales bacterium]|nr:hypothetical protein [Burkholderiales bacterium]
MSRSSRRRKTGKIALVAALAATVIALELARAGIADFLRLEPCAYLDLVQASGRRPDPALLGKAKDRLELARRIDPDNPVVREYLAVVYVHRARLVAHDLPLHIGYLERAESDYRDALVLRPNSPYLWAGLVVVRGGLLAARMQRHDGAGEVAQQRADFQSALRRAISMSAYEPAALEAIVRTAAPLRDTLDEDVVRGVADVRARLEILRHNGAPPL